MAADMYDNPGADEAASEESAAPEESQEDTNKKTALIDSAICPDMKPGEEMVVKIERVMDGQYLVSYAPEPGDESGPEEESPAPESEMTGEPAMAASGGGMYE